MANLRLGTTFIMRQEQPKVDCPTNMPNTTEAATEVAVAQKTCTDPAASDKETNSSYLSADGSLLSQELDCWIQSWDNDSNVVANPTKTRVATVQRSTLTSRNSVYSSRLYYALAMMMPMFRSQQRAVWSSCSPSIMLTTLRSVFIYMGEAYNKIRVQFRRHFTEHAIHELFTTILDMLLVVYAVGFFIISMYESAVTP